MMRGALVVLVVVSLPTIAPAYTLTLGAMAIGDQPSRFEETELGVSIFVERKSNSSVSVTEESSSFGLKDVAAESGVEMERTLTELGARQDGGRIIVNLPSDVLFDFDRSHIRADALPVLSRLADVLEAMPGKPVAIIGHTDSKGGDDYNQQLSEERAASVETWLERMGVTSRMTTEGKGEALPVAPNQKADGSDDPDGRQKNRRVEFIIG